MFARLEAWFGWLTSDPVSFLIYALYFAVAMLTSLILHELAHAYVALRCGDPTAKWMGRLTLDPRKHLDPLGTILMVLLGFGWAKPVPVNPRNFRNGRRDDFLVSIAGIVTNLTLFLFCAALSVGVNRLIWEPEFLTAFSDEYGSLQGLMNLYHDDGIWASAIAGGGSYDYLSTFARYPWLLYVQRFLLMMAQINLALAIFNFLPIPPLDGSHLLNDTLLRGRMQLDTRTFRIAQTVLIVVCMSGMLSKVLSVANSAVYTAVLNVFLRMAGSM
ncbi:MAG: site-2 protease family protein [Aristaeellaceae bacterium]